MGLERWIVRRTRGRRVRRRRARDSTGQPVLLESEDPGLRERRLRAAGSRNTRRRTSRPPGADENVRALAWNAAAPSFEEIHSGRAEADACRGKKSTSGMKPLLSRLEEPRPCPTTKAPWKERRTGRALPRSSGELRRERARVDRGRQRQAGTRRPARAPARRTRRRPSGCRSRRRTRRSASVPATRSTVAHPFA